MFQRLAWYLFSFKMSRTHVARTNLLPVRHIPKDGLCLFLCENFQMLVVQMDLFAVWHFPETYIISTLCWDITDTRCAEICASCVAGPRDMNQSFLARDHGQGSQGRVSLHWMKRADLLSSTWCLSSSTQQTCHQICHRKAHGLRAHIFAIMGEILLTVLQSLSSSTEKICHKP